MRLGWTAEEVWAQSQRLSSRVSRRVSRYSAVSPIHADAEVLGAAAHGHAVAKKYMKVHGASMRHESVRVGGPATGPGERRGVVDEDATCIAEGIFIHDIPPITAAK